jgi:F-type H+-transporting ATPase subunit delta
MIDPVTSRYAEALFRLARSRGVLDEVSAAVRTLAADCAERGEPASVFDERLPLEARRSRAQANLSGLHPLVQNLVNLLFDKRRIEVLRGLGAAFRRRALEERGAAEGVVESARPLAEGELSELARALGPRLGKELVLTNKIDPTLLGGLRVVVESKMIDASLQGRLEGLRKRLLAAPLPQLSGS